MLFGANSGLNKKVQNMEEDIDIVIAKFLGRIFGLEKISPNDLVGRICTLRIQKSDSVISYDTKIVWVFTRVYHMSRTKEPVVAEVCMFFDGGATASIDFPIGSQNEPEVDLRAVSEVVFDKLPIYIHSKGKGNIILR